MEDYTFQRGTITVTAEAPTTLQTIKSPHRSCASHFSTHVDGVHFLLFDGQPAVAFWHLPFLQYGSALYAGSPAGGRRTGGHHGRHGGRRHRRRVGAGTHRLHWWGGSKPVGTNTHQSPQRGQAVRIETHGTSAATTQRWTWGMNVA